MKTDKKARILALLLCLVMTVSQFGMTAYGEDGALNGAVYASSAEEAATVSEKAEETGEIEGIKENAEAAKSGETDGSEKAAEPEKTDEPEKTTESEKTTEPEKATESEKTTEPEKATESGEADEPEKATEPGKTDEPEKATESGKADEPEKTTESGKTDEPEKTTESGKTDEPEKTTESGKADGAEDAAKPGETVSSAAASSTPADSADSANGTDAADRTAAAATADTETTNTANTAAETTDTADTAAETTAAANTAAETIGADPAQMIPADISEPEESDETKEPELSGSAAVSETSGSEDKDTFEIEIVPADEYWGAYGQTTTYCHLPQVIVKGQNIAKITYSAEATFPKESWSGEIENTTNETSIVVAMDKDARGDIKITVTGKDNSEETFSLDVGHTFGRRNSTYVSASCETPARSLTTYQCSRCMESYYSYYSVASGAEALGHKFDAEKKQTIDVCGSADEKVEISPCANGCGKWVTSEGTLYAPGQDAGHEWVEEKKEATCTTAGYIRTVCSKCHAVKTGDENEKVIPATGHRWTDFEVENKGSCTEAGSRVRTCLNGCGAKESIPINGGHSTVRTAIYKYKEQLEKTGTWKEEWAPSCTKDGAFGDVCTICFKYVKVLTANSGMAPALGHDYGTTGDCTQSVACKRCGQTIKGNSSHQWSAYGKNESGHYRYCTREGCTVTEGTADAPAAHVFPSGPHDCTVRQACERCGFVKDGAVEQEHQWVDAHDATHHWKKCANEGCTVTTAKEAHTAVDPKDCTKDMICTRCGNPVREKRETHDMPDTWSTNYAVHYSYCQSPGCKHSERGNHVAEKDDGDCFTSVKCSICDTVLKPGSQHNFSYSPIKGDTEGHYRECANAGCKQIQRVTGSHTGGTATCHDPAVCELCGLSYGEKNPENHVGGQRLEGYREATKEQAGYTGDLVCVGCGETLKKGEVIPKLEEQHVHSYTKGNSDITSHWMECECGDIDPNSRKEHDLEFVSDENGHYRRCKNGCGYRTETSPHVPNAAEIDDDCTTAVHCQYCGAVTTEAEEHNFDEKEWFSDETGHWKVCTNENCGKTSDHAKHAAADDGDCTTKLVCDDCGYVMAKAESSHLWSSAVSGSDADGHWFICENEGCKAISREEHTPEEDDGLCTTSVLCTTCGRELKPAQKEHVLGAYLSDKAAGHYQKCENENCSYQTAVEPHSGPEADCVTEQVCELCKEKYGEKDPDNHVPGKEELRGHKDATTEEEGYSGDLFCGACGAFLESGTLLPKLTEEQAHSHQFAGYSYDSVKHWRECVNGCGTWEKAEGEPHELTYEYNMFGHRAGCVCGYGAEGDFVPHRMETFAEGGCHWQACAVCGLTTAKESHVSDDVWKTDGESHWKECTVCGTVIEKAAHAPGSEWKTDGESHWKECTVCGAAVGKTAHTAGSEWKTDGENHWKECTVCGTVLEKAAHTPGSEWKTDGESHWKECTVCGAAIGKTAHTPSSGWKTDGGNHWKECAACGAVLGKTAHTPGREWEQDADSHWHLCTVCKAVTDKAGHRYNDSGVCSDCGASDPEFVLKLTATAAPEASDDARAILKKTVQDLPEDSPLMKAILKAAAENKDISVELLVTDKGVSGSRKTVDIDIMVYADGEPLGAVEKTGSPITFTISLDGLTGRVVHVRREHNGSTKEIPSRVSGGNVIFSSKLFSTFTIEADNDISGAEVSAVPDQTYTGKAIEPEVSLTINGGEKLKEGTDYVLSYRDNVEPGTAAVIITGIGDFEGSSTKVTFRIVKSDDAPAAAAGDTAPPTGDNTPVARYMLMLALCAGFLALRLWGMFFGKRRG